MRQFLGGAVLLLLMLGAMSQAPASAPVSGGVQPGCQGHAHYHSAAEHRRWAKRFLRAEKLPRSARERHRHQVACAESAEDRAAMKRFWKKVQRSILPANHDLWIRIGRCEQPGSGYRGVYWSHPGPTYQGGLGFWHGTWDGYKYKGMPANAGDATWRQQMKVANKLLRLYGTSPWGCA